MIFEIKSQFGTVRTTSRSEDSELYLACIEAGFEFETFDPSENGAEFCQELPTDYEEREAEKAEQQSHGYHL